MAKVNNRKRGGAAHKTKSDTGVLRKVIIAVVAIAICMYLAWLLGWGFTGNINPAKWGKTDAGAGNTEAAALVVHTHEINLNSAQEAASVSGELKAPVKPTLTVSENPGATSIAPEHTGSLCIVGGYTTVDVGASSYYDLSQCPECGSMLMDNGEMRADCMYGAGRLRVCDNEDCGWFYTYVTGQEKDPTNHQYYRCTSKVEPTCTTEGYEVHTCLCGNATPRTYPISKLPHSYSWVVTKQPNGSESGIESYTCSGCSNVQETRTFQALPPEPVKEGYRFIGWYKDEALTEPYTSERIYGDISLYAKFEINKYTVTFNSDGGSKVADITVEWGTKLTPTVPTKEGYNFIGWFKQDGIKYEGEEIKGDTSLTAHWQIKTFTVTFYVNDQIYRTVTVEYGAVLSKVADDTAVYASNIVAFFNLNSDTPTTYAEEMKITDDMRVIANEPTVWQKIFHKRSVPFIIAGVSAVVILGVLGGVAAAKKKRG